MISNKPSISLISYSSGMNPTLPSTNDIVRQVCDFSQFFTENMHKIMNTLHMNQPNENVRVGQQLSKNNH